MVLVPETLVGYKPTGPYAFQSGKRVGQALELLMFTDYHWLKWMLDKLEEESKAKKNRLHLHLEWLLRQGETIQPKMTCPQCGERPVVFFSVAYSLLGSDFAVGTEHTYCEECRKSVDTSFKPIDLFSFHFSTLGLKEFRYGYSRDQIVGLFKKVYGLPKPLTRERAFEFFSSAEPYMG